MTTGEGTALVFAVAFFGFRPRFAPGGFVGGGALDVLEFAGINERPGTGYVAKGELMLMVKLSRRKQVVARSVPNSAKQRRR